MRRKGSNGRLSVLGNFFFFLLNHMTMTRVIGVKRLNSAILMSAFTKVVM